MMTRFFLSISILLVFSNPALAGRSSLTLNEIKKFVKNYAAVVGEKNRDKHFQFFSDNFTFSHFKHGKKVTVNYAEMMNARFALWSEKGEYSFEDKKFNLKEMARGSAKIELISQEVQKIDTLKFRHDRTEIYELEKTVGEIKIKSIDEIQYIKQVL